MSRPLPRRTDHDDAADAELARWPGVTWTRTLRGKHYALVLEYGGVSRFVIYPATGSDRRGPLNCVRDIRAACRDLGAKRTERLKSSAPHRAGAARRKGQAPERFALPPRDPTRLDRDPWEALKGFECAPPPQAPEPAPLQPPPGLWARLLAFVKGLRP